jgi:hypothetical protein
MDCPPLFFFFKKKSSLFFSLKRKEKFPSPLEREGHKIDIFKARIIIEINQIILMCKGDI